MPDGYASIDDGFTSQIFYKRSTCFMSWFTKVTWFADILFSHNSPRLARMLHYIHFHISMTIALRLNGRRMRPTYAWHYFRYWWRLLICHIYLHIEMLFTEARHSEYIWWKPTFEDAVRVIFRKSYTLPFVSGLFISWFLPSALTTMPRHLLLFHFRLCISHFVKGSHFFMYCCCCSS